jgi:hypothetical protein
MSDVMKGSSSTDAAMFYLHTAIGGRRDADEDHTRQAMRKRPALRWWHLGLGKIRDAQRDGSEHLPSRSDETEVIRKRKD